MINTKILREIQTNKTKHEIFTSQLYHDLLKIPNALNQPLNTEDLLVTLDAEQVNKKIVLTQFNTNSKEKNAWSHYIALEVLKYATKKWNLSISYDLSEQEKYLKMITGNKITKIAEELIDFGKVIQVLNSLKINNLRLHFILENRHNDLLYSGLSDYLEKDLPFVTMIYQTDPFHNIRIQRNNSQHMEYLWESYDYELFEGFNDSEFSVQTRVLGMTNTQKRLRR